MRPFVDPSDIDIVPPGCLARACGSPRPHRVPAWLSGIAMLLATLGSAPDARAEPQGAWPACAQSARVPDGALEVAAVDDRFSVEARGVPLCAVLAAVTAEAGLSLVGEVADAAPVTVRFEQQRLARVLDRLLGDGGYLLVFTQVETRRGWLRVLATASAPTTEATGLPADDTATPAATTFAGGTKTRDAAIDARRARREAIEAIEWAGELYGADAVGLLTSALAHADSAVRETAVEELAMLDTASAREALLGALHDPSADVRLEVVDTLGDLDGERSTAALREALADPDARVREAAADLLAERAD